MIPGAMSAPVYRHKSLQDHAYAEEPEKQFPNRFTAGDNRVNPETGVEEVALWQEGRPDPEPVWVSLATFDENYEKIPLVG